MLYLQIWKWIVFMFEGFTISFFIFFLFNINKNIIRLDLGTKLSDTNINFSEKKIGYTNRFIFVARVIEWIVSSTSWNGNIQMYSVYDKNQFFFSNLS